MWTTRIFHNFWVPQHKINWNLKCSYLRYRGSLVHSNLGAQLGPEAQPLVLILEWKQSLDFELKSHRKYAWFFKKMYKIPQNTVKTQSEKQPKYNPWSKTLISTGPTFSPFLDFFWLLYTCFCYDFTVFFKSYWISINLRIFSTFLLDMTMYFSDWPMK